MRTDRYDRIEKSTREQAEDMANRRGLTVLMFDIRDIDSEAPPQVQINDRATIIYQGDGGDRFAAFCRGFDHGEYHGLRRAGAESMFGQ